MSVALPYRVPHGFPRTRSFEPKPDWDTEARVLNVIGNDILVDPSFFTSPSALQDLRQPPIGNQLWISANFIEALRKTDDVAGLLAKFDWHPFRSRQDSLPRSQDVLRLASELRPYRASQEHLDYLESHYPGPWNFRRPMDAILADTWSFMATHSGFWTRGRSSISALKRKGVAVLDLQKQRLAAFRTTYGSRVKKQLSFMLIMEDQANRQGLDFQSQHILVGLANVIVFVLDP